MGHPVFSSSKIPPDSLELCAECPSWRRRLPLPVCQCWSAWPGWPAWGAAEVERRGTLTSSSPSPRLIRPSRCSHRRERTTRRCHSRREPVDERKHTVWSKWILQGGWGGWPTGNGKKLSSCHAQLGQVTCLAVAYFFLFHAGHPLHPPGHRKFLSIQYAV